MKFTIKQGDELLTSHSGLAIIGNLLHRTQIQERISQVHLHQRPDPAISHGTVAQTMIGLLCLGKPDFTAVEPFRSDPFFAAALHLDSVPSEATLRQRLDDAEGAFDDILREENATLIKRFAPALTPCHENYLALDIDVSPFDNSRTKKEGVSWTYKKVDGYAPIFAYLAQEGYQINVEMREGKQHGQNGMPSFLRDTIRLAKSITDSPLLLRVDAGHQSMDNIAVCIDEGAQWLIKRNLRQESMEEWATYAQAHGTVSIPRLGKTVYRGDRYVEQEGFQQPLRQVFQVTVRHGDPTGQALLVPEVEVETYETSLPDDPETIVALYHDHGTSEQFHSEIKTDLDLERLPSGKMATNALILLLGLVAYNCLRLCGQESLRQEGVPAAEQAPIGYEVHRRRLRRVLQDLIYVASRVVFHARQWALSFGRDNPWYPVWQRVYRRFAEASG